MVYCLGGPVRAPTNSSFLTNPSATTRIPDMEHCPICKGPANLRLVPDVYEIECDKCGCYQLALTLASEGFDHPELLIALRAFIAHENANGGMPQLNSNNWKMFAEQYRKPLP
jgi:hypothetical protein